MIREGNYKAHEVYALGYFEAYRLFWIIDELRARDLQQLGLVLDYAQCGDTEFRNEISGWLNGRQTRLGSPSSKIPQEVLDKFAGEFANG